MPSYPQKNTGLVLLLLASSLATTAFAATFPHLSQQESSHPNAYCGPTAVAMGVLGLQSPTASSPQTGLQLVETLAQRYLHTSPTEGTTDQQVFDGLRHYLQETLPVSRQAVLRYRGLHAVSEQPRTTVRWQDVATPPCAKVRQPCEGFHLLHVGWYRLVPSQHRLVRTGGHYVLLTQASTTRRGLGQSHTLALQDPWLTVSAQQQREGQPLVQGRTLLAHPRRWQLQDASGQVATQTPVAELLFFNPFMGYNASLLPLLEGVLTVRVSV